MHLPTLQVSEKDPKTTDEFYQRLDKLIAAEKKSKHTVILIRDFSAKTGSGYQLYKDNMGKHEKDQLNSNGKYLLNTLRDNDTLITNNCFPHKLAHHSTWISPQGNGNISHHDATIRHNPYGNQTVYIIVKKSQGCLLTDSRSLGGFESQTDHRLVKMQMKLDGELYNYIRLNYEGVCQKFI